MSYEKKKKQFQPVKILLVLAIIFPIVLIIIATTLGRKELSLPHRIEFEVVGMVQSGLSNSMGFFDDIWDHYISLVGVSRENERLKEEIISLKGLNAQYREAAATNVRLSKLLDLEQTFNNSPVLTAQIIGRDPSLWFKTLTINKGSSSGIKKGMPVVTLEGVVGQIINLSPHFSKVLLTTDPNSAIDALVQKNRTQGIIKGDGQGYNLHYVLKNSQISSKDQIVTSGMGGVFPKGLTIGEVSEVLKSRRGMFQKIKVEPAVNFRTLEYVTIILKTDSLAE